MEDQYSIIRVRDAAESLGGRRPLNRHGHGGPPLPVLFHCGDSPVTVPGPAARGPAPLARAGAPRPARPRP